MSGQQTRRRFVGTMCGAIGLLPSSLRAEPGATTHTPPDASRTGDVAAQNDRNRHLTVEVRINGKGPYQFVVDTGADRTVVAEDVAVAAGLVTQGDVDVEGIIKTVPARTVAIDRLSLGSLSRTQLSAAVLPREMLYADGYLGLDALDTYRVTFDFAKATMRVEEPQFDTGIYMPQTKVAHVAMSGSMGHLRSLNCTVNGVSATAFIDSGAEVSMGNHRLLQAMTDRSPGSYAPIAVPLTGVTGGLIEGKMVPIERIELSHLWFGKSQIVIADLQIFDIWGLLERPALLIGMNFLRTFARVSIDYGRKDVRFELAELVAQRPMVTAAT